MISYIDVIIPVCPHSLSAHDIVGIFTDALPEYDPVAEGGMIGFHKLVMVFLFV